MSVAYPWAIGVGAILGALMIIWHILRPRSPMQVIPSLRLWRDLHPESHAHRPIHPPQPWWLLALRLLILAVLTFAAAAPIIAPAQNPQQVIIVIDTSASMATRHNDKERIDSAKAYAQQVVASAPVGSDITLLRTDAAVEIIASRESDRVRINQLIDAITVVPVAGRLDQLAQWLIALSGRTSVVYVMSDDARLMQYDWPVAWRRIPIGGVTRNDAIDDVFVMKRPDGWLVRVRMQRYGAFTTGEPTRLIEVRAGDGRLVAANRAQFDDAGQFVWEFALPGALDTLQFRLAPSAEDALSVDDVLYWQVPTALPLRVFVQSEDRRFIPAALAILPNTQLITDVLQADMAIVTGGTIDALPDKPVWVIDATMPDSPTVSTPRLARVALSGIENTINRDIDVTSTQILTATVLDVPLWGQRWLTSQSGTHAYLGTRDGYPTVVFGFDLQKSDLVLRPEFPLLVRNILEYLTPLIRQTSWQTSEDIPLGPSDSAPSVVSAPPESQARIVKAGKQYYLRNVTHPGVYQLSDRQFVVNIQNRDESNVIRTEEFAMVVPMSSPSSGALTWSQWLVIGGALLLLFERWYAQRQRRVT